MSQAASPSRQQPPAPPTVPQVVQSAETFQSQLPQSIQAVEPAPAPFAYQTYQSQLQSTPRTVHPSPAAPPQTWQAPNGIAPEQTQDHLPQQMIQPRGPYRHDAWNPTYQPAGAPAGPIDHTATSSFEYPDQTWSSDQYFAQGVCDLFFRGFGSKFGTHSMTRLVTRNLTCLKVVHQMNRRHHLPKLPIHPVDVNVLGPRSVYASKLCLFPLTGNLAYSRTSRFSIGESAQSQCAFSYSAITGCQEHVRREPIHT